VSHVSRRRNKTGNRNVRAECPNATPRRNKSFGPKNPNGRTEVIARFEVWLMAKLVERRVRKALEPYVKATVQMLVGQTSDGIPAAAPATIVSLVLGAQQEAAPEATEAPETLAEADEVPDDVVEVPEAYSAEPETIPEPEPSAEEKRAALAVALASRPARTPEFAELLLQARGGNWE
jgi:hypothetical protein